MDEGPNGREGEATVDLAEARRQKSAEQTELAAKGTGREARSVCGSGEAEGAVRGEARPGTDHLLERVVERGNLLAALKRVQANKGSPGIDGMTVEELAEHLKEAWPDVREALLEGRYEPRPVKRVEIPKPGGGVRMLGIPTALDRFLQQAILQVLQPIFDPTFSPSVHGFRPGRRAHDAVCAAQRFIQEGRRWVVDVDLEKFFDRVSHDVLMSRLEQRIGDGRLLGVIRRFLNAGMMADGVMQERHEGTPQGGPLSPLLANVLLDEVDKELERRGHRFARYADDCNVYVRSRRAGEDVMALLRGLYEGLHLRVNEAKSAVARPWERKFLGYSFWFGAGGEVRRKVAPKAIASFKEKVRELTERNGGRSLGRAVEELAAYLRGWKGYYGLAQTPRVFRELDEWIRHRLRALMLKQWKRGRTAYRRLRRLGASERAAAAAAANPRRWWHNAGKLLHTVVTTAFFDRLGLPRLA
jgi:group II intron reverse transcriptase/maturase